MEDKVSGRTWFAAVALFLAYMLSYADRTLLTLLVEPIKADLQLTDVQMSLLLGVAFSLTYTTLGVPIAVLADRGSRKRIILAGMALWTLATAACGLTRAYVPLFILRATVGIGETCLGPSAYSLLGDLFPRRLLGRALSIYNCGVYVGSGSALIVGGTVTAMAMAAGPVDLPLLGDVQAWQMAFFAMGVIGLPFLGLMALVHEPARRPVPKEQTSMAALGGHVLRTRSFIGCYISGLLLITIGGLAIQSWAPSIMIRVHGWSLRDAGLAVGMIFAVFGSIGALGASLVAEAWERRGARDAIVRIMAIAAGLEGLSALLLISANEKLALAGIALTMGLSAVQAGIGHAALQLTTPPRLRAKIASFTALIIALTGMSLGPLIAAMITQYGFGSDMALGRAVGFLGLGCFAGSCLLFTLGRKPYLAAVLREDAATAAAVDQARMPGGDGARVAATP